MKYKIKKNTVQETLMIPLYGRKMCSELYPKLYRDETAIRLMDEVDYDFSALEKKSGSMMQRFGFLEAAMRQNDLAFEVRDYLRAHPNAAVVNLGCGLDNTGRSCDNGSCRIYNLDFPDVIAVRDELLPAGEREKNIPCDLNDTSWFSEIDAADGAVFYAAGVFYYFEGTGQGACAEDGRGFPGERPRVRRGKRKGREAHAENVDKGRGDKGCRRVFRSRGRCERDLSVGRAPYGLEPWIYARLQ